MFKEGVYKDSAIQFLIEESWIGTYPGWCHSCCSVASDSTVQCLTSHHHSFLYHPLFAFQYKGEPHVKMKAGTEHHAVVCTQRRWQPKSQGRQNGQHEVVKCLNKRRAFYFLWHYTSSSSWDTLRPAGPASSKQKTDKDGQTMVGLLGPAPCGWKIFQADWGCYSFMSCWNLILTLSPSILQSKTWVFASSNFGQGWMVILGLFLTPFLNVSFLAETRSHGYCSCHGERVTGSLPISSD